MVKKNMENGKNGKSLTDKLHEPPSTRQVLHKIAKKVVKKNPIYPFMLDD